MTAMNLSQLNPSKSLAADLQLTNPYDGQVIVDADSNPVVITLHGMQSSIARNKFAELKKKNKDLDEEETGAEILAALTESWSSNLVTDLGSLPCNFKNAKALYLAEDWIAAQILAFVTEVSNFAPKI